MWTRAVAPQVDDWRAGARPDALPDAPRGIAPAGRDRFESMGPRRSACQAAGERQSGVETGSRRHPLQPRGWRGLRGRFRVRSSNPRTIQARPRPIDLIGHRSKEMFRRARSARPASVPHSNRGAEARPWGPQPTLAQPMRARADDLGREASDRVPKITGRACGGSHSLAAPTHSARRTASHCRLAYPWVRSSSVQQPLGGSPSCPSRSQSRDVACTRSVFLTLMGGNILVGSEPS
jgi:hypothetical protein